MAGDNLTMNRQNPVSIENLKPGAVDWLLDNPATNHEVEGYASATSVNRGDTILLYVNTKAERFTYAVYRVGWYQSMGARLVVAPMTEKGTNQVIPPMDSRTGMLDCSWVNPIKLSTINVNDSDDWQSGVYLVKLTESSAGKQSYIIFTVRDEARQADILLQQSVTTYQAYNNWGGKSLYKWNSTNNQRANKVSFNRPYAGNQQNPAAAYGIGAGEFLCNVQPNNPDYPISNAGWEVNMVRWLEREGYDVAYCTNLDVHEKPGLLQKCRAFISIGHDEYWTWEMRNHLENALDDGVNLGFFGANTGYWQVRLESSTETLQADRVMVCHKSAKRDPYAEQINHQHLTTCQWRDAPVYCPEAQLLGVMYVADPVDGDIVVCNTQHWVFDHTGLADGARLSGLLGYEVDSLFDCSPNNLIFLANSPWTKLNDHEQGGVAHVTFYTTDKGASVFAAGSIQWSWGLDDFNAPQLRAKLANPAVKQITGNVLGRFIGK
jgi:hypothetical protein